MPTAIKGFLLAATFFGLIGITLTYDAIARLKQHQVPPFHPEGFYTVVYDFPKPPEPIILFYNSLLGRILVVSSALGVPAFFSYLQINRERPVSAFFLLFVWSIITGFFGLWSWIFSVFAAN